MRDHENFVKYKSFLRSGNVWVSFELHDDSDLQPQLKRMEAILNRLREMSLLLFDLYISREYFMLPFSLFFLIIYII